MKTFEVRVNGIVRAISENLTKIITEAYEILDGEHVSIDTISINEKQFASKDSNKIGRIRSVGFDRIDEYVRDGATLEGLDVLFDKK